MFVRFTSISICSAVSHMAVGQGVGVVARDDVVVAWPAMLQDSKSNKEAKLTMVVPSVLMLT